MHQIPSPDWLDEKPRRRGGCGFLVTLLLLGALGGGGAWWLGNASPWAEEVQSRWADSEPGRQVAALKTQWTDSPVGRWVDGLLALTDSGQRLARLAPPDTRVYAEIAPSWWTRLGMYGLKPTPSEETAASLTEMRTWVREQFGLDWDADVAPWVQPEMGLLGRASGLEAESPDEWSLWLGTNSDERAAVCLAKARDHQVAAGATTHSGHHGRTSYDVVTPVDGQPYATAILAGYAVVAAPPRAIEALIDQVEQGGPTLVTHNPRYRRVADAWPRGAVGHAFVDAGAGKGLVRPDASLPPLEAIGGSLSGGADHFTVELTTAFDVSQAPAEARERWREIIPTLDMARFDRLPAATVLAVGATATPETSRWLSGPLAMVWGPLGGGVGEGAIFSGLFASLSSMQGPFAVGLVASSAESGASNPVGAVFSVQPKDTQALQDELDRAATVITSQTDPSRLPGPVGNWASNPWVRSMIPGVTSLSEETHGRDKWKVLKAGGKGLAGWTVAERELVLVGGDEALKLCQADRFSAISGVSGFEDVRRRLPGSPGVMVYADGPNMVHLFEASPWLPAKYAGQARRALKPLRAVGAAAAPGLDRGGFHRAAFTVLVTP